MIKIYKTILWLLFIVAFRNSYAQQCGNCNVKPSVTIYDLNLPEDAGDEALQNLLAFSRKALSIVYENNQDCIWFMEKPPAPDDTVRSLLLEKNPVFANYLLSGYIKKQEDGYLITIQLQTSCSRKPVAVSERFFQLTSDSGALHNEAQQIAKHFFSLIDKIKQFELKQRRENKNVALEGGFGDAILIIPKKANLAPDEQTEIEIKIHDCDGEPLGNCIIVFTNGNLNGISISAGTTGGIVTPSTVTTDASGRAKANFKMGSGKSAIINAHYLYENPFGCNGVKFGSTPIGNIPIKVELSYIQNETHWIKRATLPGVKMKGGLETEQYVMFHNAVIYHYPSASNLKKGYLVMAENTDPEPGSKTEYVLETGYYDFTKKVEDAKIMGMAGNIEMVQDVEKGSQNKIEGFASLAHHSEIMFTTGNSYEPASFMWNVQYPASSGNDIAGGGATIVKGDEDVQWKVNKITDPKSVYKTEYLLELKLDAEEELKKGNKAMKELFGFDTDGLTKVIDPTNPQSNMAGASGSQTIIVRILSSYPDK